MKEYLKGLLGYHYHVTIEFDIKNGWIGFWCRSVYGISSTYKWKEFIRCINKDIPCNWDIDTHNNIAHGSFTLFLRLPHYDPF